MGLAAALVLSACTVAESYRVGMAPGETDYGAPIRPRCSSEIGSYQLPMTTWAFEINSYDDSPFILEQIVEKRHPDSRHTYCLDYLANALAADKLEVGYTATTAKNGATAAISGGLLDYVASYAVDKTANVMRNLIRAVFIGISGRAGFDFSRKGLDKAKIKTHGRFEVDPLDAEEMAALNRRLADFGFCLVLHGYTVDRSVSGDAYCAAPQKMLSRHPSYELQKEREKSWLKTQPERLGVLYRPRIPYALEIYTQDDPGHSAWELRKITQVKLENLAPVVSLGINRAAFASARVGLDFDEGALKNFCLAKSSEVRGFIEIPLEVVYGIAELPTETIRAEFDRANASADLVDAEMKLLDAQSKFLAFQRSKDTKSPFNTSASDAIGNTRGECANCPKTNPAEEKPVDVAFLANGSNGICEAMDKKVAVAAAEKK